ncbi:MAG: 23S rRNA (uracil(1939)-C(5))-methyltransferase RlmD [Lachnospiraceae bacterium]|nr:23S rRNA (uracil(1939)-C(5))-methyltransferase RlmD [Lachnospiraceae bacterium]
MKNEYENGLTKNATVTVTIEDMNTDGEGIGKVNGFPLFIKDSMVGDVCEVLVIKLKKNYGYGKVLRLLTPSKDRVNAKCPIARKCGGCQIQEMDYQAQLAFKEQKVVNNLKRLGGILPETYLLEPILGMEEPWHYRNKAQYPVTETIVDGTRVIRMGFYAGRTHSVIETEECLIGDPVNEQVLAIIREYMMTWNIPAYDEEAHRGLIRHILIRKGFYTGEVMVCLVINGSISELLHVEELEKHLQKVEGMTSLCASVNTKKTNAIMGDSYDVLWGKGFIEDYIGDIRYRISPLSFFQVNPLQTRKLYGKALEYAGLTGKEEVWDLYCGTGTITLFVARAARKVHGVEIIPQAIENARENAAMNQITNAEFFVGKSEEILPAFYAEEKERLGGRAPHADVIIVDPPRKGCEESLLSCMMKMEPDRIVYVSCDSATLARDLKFLTATGEYGVEKVCACDMFPHSVHVETVCLLTRK